MVIKLVIDTCDQTRLALINSGGDIVDEITKELCSNQTETLLQYIDSLLARNNLSKIDISEILVNAGPGSYTGLRVGLTTANLLALSLNIPINQLSNISNTENHFSLPVAARYANEPFITKQKPRLI